MKKLLALVLTVCLVLGLASIAVAEADGPKYARDSQDHQLRLLAQHV